jgi:hypothetical protein
MNIKFMEAVEIHCSSEELDTAVDYCRLTGFVVMTMVHGAEMNYGRPGVHVLAIKAKKLPKAKPAWAGKELTTEEQAILAAD